MIEDHAKADIEECWHQTKEKIQLFRLAIQMCRGSTDCGRAAAELDLLESKERSLRAALGYPPPPEPIEIRLIEREPERPPLKPPQAAARSRWFRRMLGVSGLSKQTA